MNKPQKILVTISLIIAVLLGSWYYYQSTHLQSKINPDDNIPYVEEYKEVKQIPDEIFAASKKYNLFQDIYSSNKKVLVYGYENNDDSDSVIFNKFKKSIKKVDLKDYKIITTGDTDKYLQAILKKAGIDEDNEHNIGTDVLPLITSTMKCFSSCCIIDPQNKKYVVLSKNPEFIIKEMIEYNK